MNERRQCKQCGSEYTIKRRSQLFCTPSCRETYKYEQRKNDVEGLKQENEELKAKIEELLKTQVKSKRKQAEAA